VVNSGDDIHFTVNVTGMSTGGTVIATIAAGVCTSIATAVGNRASTSTDNQVTWLAPPDTDLEAWYDAADISTLTLAGSEVTQWDDKSGNVHHLTRPVGATGPDSGTRTKNSLNVVDFNAGSFSIMMFNNLFTAPSTYTMFVVCVQDTTPASPFISTVSLFVGVGSNTGIRIDNTAPEMISNNGSFVITGSAYTDGNWRQITGEHKGGGQTMSLWQNGSPIGTNTPAGTGSGNFNIGNIAAPGIPLLDGAIAEILIYSPNIDSTQRAEVETYLTTKWGPFP
jgi:hypothetical protein